MKYNIYDIPHSTDLTNLVIGKNAKKVLIVLSEKEYASHSVFLDKIMSAVSLNLFEDCLICQMPSYAYIKFSDFKSKFAMSKLILFGVNFQQLGLQIQCQQNQICIFQSIELLPTFSLSALEQDSQKKRILWMSLKSLFQER
jgi:hypothetical protein